MAENKPLTGYPSVDKPWLKYYDPVLAAQPLPQKTIYEYMRDTAMKNTNLPAFTYNGHQITYQEFLDNIESATKILAYIGVKQGDRIMCLAANIPETAYLFYGAVRLGAVSDYVDPRPDSSDFTVSARKILKMAIDEKAKFIMAMDICYLTMIAPVEKELQEAGIQDVIIVSPSQSMTVKDLLFYSHEYAVFNGLTAMLKKLNNQSYLKKSFSKSIKQSVLRIHLYDELMSKTINTTYEEVPFAPRRLTAITHSSGTSGTFPKAIPLVNEGINSYAFQAKRSNVNAGIGDKYLHILPYFSAYGLVLSHLALSSADNLIEIPEFQPKDIGQYIKKYHPSILMGTPNFYLPLPDDPALKNIDLSFIRTIGYGGDSMNPEEESIVNTFLESHGSKVKLTKGHGMSETSGGTSYAIGAYNIPGSMGIPMIDTVYGIVDPETKELQRFEDSAATIQGEFIISCPGIVSDTLDGKPVIRHGEYHGMDFVYSGDLGKIDRNGVLYFQSRCDRTFTRYDGYKVKAYEIESVVKRHPKVRDCVISFYEDSKRHGKMPIAFIISIEPLSSRKERINLAKDILEVCFIHNPEISSRQLPARISFCTSYPMTKNGKLDYKSLEKKSGSEEDILVEFEETTIEIGKIRVV